MVNEKTNNSNRFQWLYVAIIVLVFLWIGGIAFSNLIAEPYLKDRISEEFRKASENDAELVISKLNVDLFPPGITLEDLSLVQGSGASERMREHPVLNSVIGKVSISGVGVWSLLTRGDLMIKNAKLAGSDFHVSPGLMNRFNSSGQTSGQSRSVVIQNFTVSETSVNLYREDLTSVGTQLNAINLRVTDLDFTSDSTSMSNRFGLLEFEIDTVIHNTESDYYVIEGNQVSFSRETGDFLISEFFVKPQLSPMELPAQVGHEIDHLDIRSGPVELHALDLDEWFLNGHLKARSITADRLEVEISRDKNHPDKPKNARPLLNTQFSGLPFSVSIDSLAWRDGFISYREWSEGQDSSGTVFFDSVDAVITGIQNRKREETIKAEASTMFLNESKLMVQFEFSLDDVGSQKIDGTLEEIDLKTLNQVLVPLAQVQINDGHLHSIEFNFQLDQTAATGDIICIYEDFSLSFLQDESHEKSTGNRILSFLANNIQIRSSNEGEEPRSGEISFERELGQSDVNYWWKSLRSGIQDLIKRI